jgi:ribonuclease T1
MGKLAICPTDRRQTLNQFDRRRAHVGQVVAAGLCILIVLVALGGCAGGNGNGQAASQPDTAAAQPGAQKAIPTLHVTSESGLPIVLYQDLPKQAKDTIRLIDRGGPFPFSRDGITFQNREQILPQKTNGYYREYTVITPGSSDRGARRIVEGENGELFYTDDHYESFREVIR